MITSKGDDWGESFYSSTLNAFGFKKVGRGLVEFLPQKSFGGYFIEKTSYGTHVAGSVNLETDERKESLETKGSLKLLDNQAPMLAVATVDGTPWLRNASTGAEIRLPSSSSVRRTVVGVVVWTPISKPANAVLYDPVAWTTQAVWKSSEAQR